MRIETPSYAVAERAVKALRPEDFADWLNFVLNIDTAPPLTTAARAFLREHVKRVSAVESPIVQIAIHRAMLAQERQQASAAAHDPGRVAADFEVPA